MTYVEQVIVFILDDDKNGTLMYNTFPRTILLRFKSFFSFFQAGYPIQAKESSLLISEMRMIYTLALAIA